MFFCLRKRIQVLEVRQRHSGFKTFLGSSVIIMPNSSFACSALRPRVEGKDAVRYLVS